MPLGAYFGTEVDDLVELVITFNEPKSPLICCRKDISAIVCYPYSFFYES